MSVSVPSRIGPNGTADKLALLYADAEKAAQEDAVQKLALSVCSPANSSPLQCVQEIERFASQVRYRGEPKDRLRHPLETAEKGGDCDDQALLVGALLIAIGIPFEPEIVADDQCVAFHVRAVAGLPPFRPTVGYAIDSVKWSEQVWNSPPIIPENRRVPWNRPA